MVAVDKGAPLVLWALSSFFLRTSAQISLFGYPTADGAECSDCKQKECRAEKVDPEHAGSFLNYTNDMRIG